MTKALAFLRLMRPHQWVKNSFVFMGVVFGHGWDNPTLIAQVAMLFAAFCLASSAVYVMNDIADRDADRLHPTKRFRPLAQGAVGIGAAWVLCIVLAVNHGFVVWWVKAPSWGGYTLTALIVGGFMLRILAGTMGIGIPPSKWLLLCGLMLTLFLGFGKRRSELVALGGNGDANGAPGQRASLDGYSRPLLDLLIAVSVAGAAIGYALYTVDAKTITLHGTDRLILTLPFVLYGLFRYLQVMYSKGGGGDPAWEVLHDPHLIVAAVGWLGATAWFLTR